MHNRRDFLAGAVAASSLAGVAGCSSTGSDRYELATTKLRAPLGIDPTFGDFIRYATLAANGHNTQPWHFVVGTSSVSLLPDFARRTPIVDPDDHHLFVSLGGAAENLAIAARASGRPSAISFNASGNGSLDIDLGTGSPSDVALCRAIPARQSTRSIYDGRAIATSDLRTLERAAAMDGVSLLLIMDLAGRESVLNHAIEANNRQMDDPAFVVELRRWLRFNADEALQRADGLYSACTGNITAPTWLGQRLLPLVLSQRSETARYVAQLRSSSGIAIFIGAKADADHWSRVGRSFQQFALKATALGLRHAHINQPIEVPYVRTAFASSLGIGTARPDLVVRFGMAPALPMSMRRQPIIT